MAAVGDSGALPRSSRPGPAPSGAPGGAGPEEEEGAAPGWAGLGAAIPGPRIAACGAAAAAGRMIAAQLLAYYFTELKEDQVKKVRRIFPGRGPPPAHAA